jgi:carboxyl-terminal processing protease
MQFKTKIAIVVFSSIIAFYAIIGSFMSQSGQAVVRSGQYGQYNTFNEVLSHIIREYVDQPDLEKVRIGSLRGLADGLDPYCAYLTTEQVKQYDPKAVRGETGMILSKWNGYSYIVAVLKGSPADQAGIRDGALIEYVGKVPSRDLSLYDTEQLLSGQPGTSVEIRILHRGQSRKLTLARAKIVQPAIESRIEETGIGYIKVTSLAQNKSAEIKTQLSDLVSKGAQKIVLDLRGSANGAISEGVAVANFFIGSGVLARSIGKDGKEIQSYKADPARVVFNGPLAVVTDTSTAGAAEIIAAAVKDQKRGEVIGERTFGVGSEQQLFSLSDGGALLLTTAKYAPATGKPFMEESVTPTVKVDRPAEEALALPPGDDEEEGNEPEPQQQVAPPKTEHPVEDVQLKKAVEILRQAAAKGAAAQKRSAANFNSTSDRPVKEVKAAA